MCIVSSISFGCTQPKEQTSGATPIQVPKEGIPGEYIDVIIQVSNNQPCKLVLATAHKTEIDNYLNPYTSDMVTIPNSDGEIVFHQRIPAGTTPGSYILKVVQLKNDRDNDGSEIFSQTFIVK